MNNRSLPEQYDCVTRCDGDSIISVPVWNAEDMRLYARLARLAERDRCAELVAHAGLPIDLREALVKMIREVGHMVDIGVGEPGLEITEVTDEANGAQS